MLLYTFILTNHFMGNTKLRVFTYSNYDADILSVESFKKLYDAKKVQKTTSDYLYLQIKFIAKTESWLTIVILSRRYVSL